MTIEMTCAALPQIVPFLLTRVVSVITLEVKTWRPGGEHEPAPMQSLHQSRCWVPRAQTGAEI